MEKTLEENQNVKAKNENVEEKMIDCVNELHEVKVALAQEICDRDQRNRELMETGQKLSATQRILSGAREVLAVAEKATEETVAQLVRSREAHAKLRHDITAAQRIEKALFEENERLRVTLNHIGEAVITTDMSNKVTYLNPVAEAMTGWTSEEANGTPFQKYSTSSIHKPMKAPLTRLS